VSSRGPVGELSTATGSAATPAAARPAMVHARSRLGVLVSAALGLDLGGAEPQRYSSDADMVLAGGQAHDGGLAVMTDFGRDLASSADTGIAAASGGRQRTVTSSHLGVGSHLGSPLLGSQSRVFVLGTVAPNSCLLFAQESNVAAALDAGGSAPRAARLGASEIGGGRLAVGRGRRNAGCRTEGVDGGRSTGVLRVRARLLEMHRRLNRLALSREAVRRRGPGSRVAVDVGLVNRPPTDLRLEHRDAGRLRGLSNKSNEESN
jgi:hypothetical protein